MHIRFVALIFIALTLLAVTASGQREFGWGDRYRCECSGRPHLTRRCCEQHNGFFDFGRCKLRFSNHFLRCCEFQGLQGACFT